MAGYRKIDFDEKGQRDVVLNALCGNARVYAVTTWQMQSQYRIAVMTREEIDAWSGDDLMLVPVTLADGQDTTGKQFVDISQVKFEYMTAVSFTFEGKCGTNVTLALASMGFRDPAIFTVGDGAQAVVYRLKRDGEAQAVLNMAQQATIVIRRYFPGVRGCMPVVPVPKVKHGITYNFAPAQWTENSVGILSSISTVCGLKSMKPAAWNFYDEFFPVPEHEVFKTWKKVQTGSIVRMCDGDAKNPKYVVFDVATAQAGMWAMDFEAFMMRMYYQSLHPVTQPAPSRLGAEKRPQRVLEIDDIWETKKSRPKKKKIPTGIGYIDKNFGGIPEGGLSVFTGNPGGGKSTIVSQIILNVVEMGYKVELFSGEMDDTSIFDAMVNQAAGRDNLHKGDSELGSWDCDPGVEIRIKDWLRGRLGVYNNEWDFDFHEVLHFCLEDCKKRGAQILVLDNLMMLTVQGIRDPIEKQKYIVQKLKSTAASTGLSIWLVAHSKKNGGRLLTLDDILGASEIANLCDDIFAVYKASHVFKKAYLDEYGVKVGDDKDVDPDIFFSKTFGQEKKTQYGNEISLPTNIISVLKARYDMMRETTFSGLYFEIGSKRLLDYDGQQIQYGWQTKTRPPVYTKSFIPMGTATAKEVETETVDIQSDGRDAFLDLPTGD